MEKRVIDDFEILDFISNGSYGAVRQAQEKENGKLFAIKQLPKASIVKFKQIENVKQEKDNLFLLRGSEFIVELFYTFQDVSYLYFVLEYIPGGDLLGQLQQKGALSEEIVLLYAAELVLAIETLQKKNIIHRDIKPENILLTDQNHIRLIDFGCSRRLETPDEIIREFVGTANYLPPEAFDNGTGFPGDIWGLGCSLFQLLFCEKAFDGDSEYLIFQDIKRTINEPKEIPLGISNEARDLLSGLLKADPKKRLTISQIKQHSFFANIIWEELKC